MKKKNSKLVFEEQANSMVIDIYRDLIICEIKETRDIDCLCYKNPILEPLEHLRQKYNDLVNKLLEANSQMISERLVKEKIISRIFKDAFNKPDKPQNETYIEELIRKNIHDLLHYESWRDIDIPVFNFKTKVEIFNLGNISFYPFSETDKSGEWWEYIKGLTEWKKVFCYARIKSPGDCEKALDYALINLNENLLILKGLAFPFGDENIAPINTFNSHFYWHNRFIRLNTPDENIKIEGAPSTITKLGPFQRIFDLQNDLLYKISRKTLEKINCILLRKEKQKLSKMENKFLQGLSWLGEATISDPYKVQFTKIAFALEALIGGEANEDELSTRGITASLAERAAFIMGKDKEERIIIDRKIRHFYSMRSSIVHGEGKEISILDIKEFGDLVRQVAFSLIVKIEKIKDVNELQDWIRESKYSNCI
ncbi:MAG: hypothetical protein JW908_16660 [Anaerolineales bacterium]|nr:hypothetical protein [Anaerolineales bacterium]